MTKGAKGRNQFERSWDAPRGTANDGMFATWGFRLGAREVSLACALLIFFLFWEKLRGDRPPSAKGREGKATDLRKWVETLVVRRRYGIPSKVEIETSIQLSSFGFTTVYQPRERSLTNLVLPS